MAMLPGPSKPRHGQAAGPPARAPCAASIGGPGRKVASLAGLAPVARQSGTWRGKSAIHCGRAHLRQALYMPALVAARFNPDLRARFAAMTAAGKPAKVAITALMRRLVVLANALLRDDRPWAGTAA